VEYYTEEESPAKKSQSSKENEEFTIKISDDRNLNEAVANEPVEK
jgi:hypothetical protein